MRQSETMGQVKRRMSIALGASAPCELARGLSVRASGGVAAVAGLNQNVLSMLTGGDDSATVAEAGLTANTTIELSKEELSQLQVRPPGGRLSACSTEFASFSAPKNSKTMR